MRWSQWYIPTLKEAPGDAEVISHKLLIRAGMIRKLTSGIYTWLPLGLRTLNKAANIVREEMDRAGAQEILMPTVQPADLWRESGRWEHYGRNSCASRTAMSATTASAPRTRKSSPTSSAAKCAPTASFP